MPDIDQLDQVLDTQTLTASEVVLALVIIVISVLIARWARRLIRGTLSKRPNIDEHEVGDYVAFGDDSGTVEDIGPRSTRIRKLNGTLLTVPNSDIVQARIANSTKRDNALFLHTIGLRYETTIEQIEWLVAHIREGLRGHPKVEQDDDMPRVRLAAFGASSIDVEARAYVDTTSVHEFMAVQEELLAMIMRAVEAAGTSMAFPSTTAYLTRDEGIEGPGVLPPPAEAKEDVPEAEGGGAGRDSAFESDDDD